MERVYKRNQYSNHPRRNDSREDYQSGKKESGRRFVNFSAEREEREYKRDYRRGNERGEMREYRGGDERGETRGYRRRDERVEPRGYRRESERGESRGYRNEMSERGAARPTSYRSRSFKQNEETRREYRGNREYKEYREYREDRGERYGDKRNVAKRENVRNQEWISEEEKKKRQEKHYSKKKILAHRLKNHDENTELRLNRFISMGGVCSRRDADALIVSGRVKVNGEIVQTVGQKVRMSDCVEVDGVQIFPEKKVYLVLNKPKDYVTTVEDPLERKTVMSLIENACKERVYPVGRLDRQTTGVLLFTNDGDLAKKLTHPKYDHKKIYHVFLDKPLLEEDLNTIASGIELEDGFIKADEIEYASSDNTEVGIEIHSGKNRIVRRIFEHLGYQILKLDRVYFAGITKKNLPRGTWRFLTPQEVNILKVY